MRRGLMSISLEERVEAERAAEAARVEADAAAEAMVDTVVESPELDMADAVEAAGEIEAADAGIEQGAAVADGLERIAERVEASKAEGGLDAGEAEMVRVAVESMMAVIGAPAWAGTPAKPAPAMEGWADLKIDRTVALEASIKDTAKMVWAKIQAMIAKVVDWATKLFQSLFRTAETVAARAEALSKAAESKKGALVDKEAKISVPGILSVGGKVVGGGELAAAFKKHIGQGLLSEDRFADLKDVLPVLEKAIAEKRPVKATIPEINVELVFGGARFTQSAFDGSSIVVAAVESVKTEGGEVKVMTPEEVKTMADAIESHAKVVYTGVKKAEQEANATAKALLAKVKEMEKDADGVDVSGVTRLVQSALNASIKASAVLRAYDVKVLLAGLKAGAASLKLAKGKDDEQGKLPAPGKKIDFSKKSDDDKVAA